MAAAIPSDLARLQSRCAYNDVAGPVNFAGFFRVSLLSVPVSACRSPFVDETAQDARQFREQSYDRMLALSESEDLPILTRQDDLLRTGLVMAFFLEHEREGIALLRNKAREGAVPNQSSTHDEPTSLSRLHPRWSLLARALRFWMCRCQMETYTKTRAPLGTCDVKDAFHCFRTRESLWRCTAESVRGPPASCTSSARRSATRFRPLTTASKSPGQLCLRASPGLRSSASALETFSGAQAAVKLIDRGPTAVMEFIGLLPTGSELVTEGLRVIIHAFRANGLLTHEESAVQGPFCFVEVTFVVPSSCET